MARCAGRICVDMTGNIRSIQVSGINMRMYISLHSGPTKMELSMNAKIEVIYLSTTRTIKVSNSSFHSLC